MDYSVYIVASENVHPSNLVWKEPIAWNKDGEVTHFSSHSAFISKKKILGGYRFCVRAVSIRTKTLEPPE